MVSIGSVTFCGDRHEGKLTEAATASASTRRMPKMYEREDSGRVSAAAYESNERESNGSEEAL